VAFVAPKARADWQAISDERFAVIATNSRRTMRFLAAGTLVLTCHYLRIVGGVMTRNSQFIAIMVVLSVMDFNLAAGTNNPDVTAGKHDGTHETSFGAATFTKELWLNNGELVTNPTAIDVESVTAGAFALEIIDESGTVKVHNVAKNEHGGWTGWDFPSLGIYTGKYKLRFVNASSGTRQIKQGVIYTK
jgi:hypothetical protein